jgi:hypothetical protein
MPIKFYILFTWKTPTNILFKHHTQYKSVKEEVYKHALSKIKDNINNNFLLKLFINVKDNKEPN